MDVAKGCCPVTLRVLDPTRQVTTPFFKERYSFEDGPWVLTSFSAFVFTHLNHLYCVIPSNHLCSLLSQKDSSCELFTHLNSFSKDLTMTVIGSSVIKLKAIEEDVAEIQLHLLRSTKVFSECSEMISLDTLDSTLNSNNFDHIFNHLFNPTDQPTTAIPFGILSHPYFHLCRSALSHCWRNGHLMPDRLNPGFAQSSDFVFLDGCEGSPVFLAQSPNTLPMGLLLTRLNDLSFGDNSVIIISMRRIIKLVKDTINHRQSSVTQSTISTPIKFKFPRYSDTKSDHRTLSHSASKQLRKLSELVFPVLCSIQARQSTTKKKENKNNTRKWGTCIRISNNGDFISNRHVVSMHQSSDKDDTEQDQKQSDEHITCDVRVEIGIPDDYHIRYRWVPAKVEFQTDPSSNLDLSWLKIDTDSEEYRSLNHLDHRMLAKYFGFSDTSRDPRIGQLSWAIGFGKSDPIYMQRTNPIITSGVISKRVTLSDTQPSSMKQRTVALMTTAPVFGGHSGGMLVNMDERDHTAYICGIITKNATIDDHCEPTINLSIPTAILQDFLFEIWNHNTKQIDTDDNHKCVKILNDLSKGREFDGNTAFSEEIWSLKNRSHMELEKAFNQTMQRYVSSIPKELLSLKQSRL